jgi:cytoskeletal protein CcmA (bactofilin family)
LIGANTVIRGDIEFSGCLRVDGHIRGNVIAAKGEASTLVVTESAKIEGEIHATHVVLDGMINGPVEVTEFLELQPKARIIGDVRYKQIEIHLGATIDGKLEHSDGEAKAPIRLASSNVVAAAGTK